MDAFNRNLLGVLAHDLETVRKQIIDLSYSLGEENRDVDSMDEVFMLANDLEIAIDNAKRFLAGKPTIDWELKYP